MSDFLEMVHRDLYGKSDRANAPENQSPDFQEGYAAGMEVFKLATWPAFQRQQVFKRDKGICVGCGKDTMAEKIAREGKWWRGGMPNGCGHLWQADHIRALCNGDRNDLTLYGIDNLQLLCTVCHLAKTAKDRATLAKNRLALSVTKKLKCHA